MTTTIGSLDLNAFNDLYSDSNQYFWFEGNASATYGAGVHITLSPDTSFITNPTGQNILINTDGISIRNGLLPMMTLDNDSLDFNVVDTTAGTYTTTATFTATSVQIGKVASGVYNSLFDSNGLKIRENTSVIAEFGTSGCTIGEVIHGGIGQPATWVDIDKNGLQVVRDYSGADNVIADIGYGSSNVVHYTFGTRDSNSTIGTFSTVEGLNQTASGDSAHAEGYNTNATGDYSHTEGFKTSATGNYSHAQNYTTVAGYESQTVIGKFNDNQSTNAFEIGNGTSSTPSNAFMVDWNGDIYPQATKMADFIVDQGTDNNWLYRKWNSGRYEAWLRYNATGMALTSASSNTYYNATSGVKNVALPSFNVGTDYYVTGQEQPSMSSSVYIYSIQTYSATQMQVSYRAHASTANAQCNGMFYLMGKWK